jgi:hypothetical protein
LTHFLAEGTFVVLIQDEFWRPSPFSLTNQFGLVWLTAGWPVWASQGEPVEAAWRRVRSAWCREYWVIYRGPGFLAVVWFGSLPTPFPLLSVYKLVRRRTGRLRKRDKLLTGEGRKGGGPESYDRKKAWSSINHSILSGLAYYNYNPRRICRKKATLIDLSFHDQHPHGRQSSICNPLHDGNIAVTSWRKYLMMIILGYVVIKYLTNHYPAV